MTTTSGGGTLSLIHGNAVAIPLADQSVHLIVSSPPYFALRSYRDDDEHFDGQLGSEPTPHHFLAALWAVLDECWRILRDDGSCWVNLGDKFAGSRPDGSSGNGLGASTLMHDGRKNPKPFGNYAQGIQATRRSAPDRYNQSTGSLRSKSRMLLPHRFALGCQWPAYRRFEEAQAGLTPTADPPQWICRMDVVQSKVNGLPESCTDRVRASHESWFHLTKSERYFAAMDEIREEYGDNTHAKRNDLGASPWVQNLTAWGNRNDGATLGRSFINPPNALGKLPGSVWEWANEPLILPDDLPRHFAAFASWPIRRIVSGWSPSGVCVACGQPRRPVCEKTTIIRHPGDAGVVGRQDPRVKEQQNRSTRPNLLSEHTITGYACACPTPDAPTRPSVVVDPFSGTGTAPIVAAALGRHGVGVELSWDYHRIARWRDRDGGLRAKALGVDRPGRQVPGQLSLLDACADVVIEPADDGQEELFT